MEIIFYPTEILSRARTKYFFGARANGLPVIFTENLFKIRNLAGYLKKRC
jgi:hypothetical protein